MTAIETEPDRRRERIGTDGTAPVLDVVVPVYNEETDLEPCVRRLHEHLAGDFPYTFRITIADNASVDATPQVAAQLSDEIAEVRVVRLEQKGRGRALRHVWTTSDSPVLAYLDVDLSTDLAALAPLVAPLISGHSDVAIGSRLARGSQVVRGPKRELISRCYNLLLRGTLAARFSDAQCGFKAIRADVAGGLLPHVTDPAWFFDTELLVLAQRSGLRIHEVPVDWVDDPDSRVDIVSTAVADLKGIARLLRGAVAGSVPVTRLRAQLGRAPRPVSADGVPESLARQLMRFAAVGVASTLAYLALYLLFRLGVGAQAANLSALLLTAIGNTAANRSLTFRVRGRHRAPTHHLQGLIVFGLGLALTGGSLAMLELVTQPSRTLELGVLLAANLLATIMRFLLFRGWVFRPADTDGGSAGSSAGSGSADSDDEEALR